MDNFYPFSQKLTSLSLTEMRVTPITLVDQLVAAVQRILGASDTLHAVYLNYLQADISTTQTGDLLASLLASPSAKNAAISTIEL